MRGQVYRALAERYGYTPQTIAGMTPAQQLMMLSSDKQESGTLTFRDRVAYEKWHRENFGDGR